MAVNGVFVGVGAAGVVGHRGGGSISSSTTRKWKKWKNWKRFFSWLFKSYAQSSANQWAASSGRAGPHSARGPSAWALSGTFPRSLWSMLLSYGVAEHAERLPWILSTKFFFSKIDFRRWFRMVFTIFIRLRVGGSDVMVLIDDVDSAQSNSGSSSVHCCTYRWIEWALLCSMAVTY